MNETTHPSSSFDDMENWETSRRTFLRGAILAGVMSQITWFTSCSDSLKEANHILDAQQSTILDHTLMIIFPADNNGPSANDINAFGYIMWVLDDSLNRKTADNEFIINGITKLDNRSEEIFKKSFTSLTPNQQEEVIEAHIRDDKTRKWCSTLITLIFEALLLDPIYGGNVNEQGWEWLNHTPGYPRPTEKNRYEVIMSKQLKLTKTT